jgi:hypothetical protein
MQEREALKREEESKCKEKESKHREEEDKKQAMVKADAILRRKLKY